MREQKKEGETREKERDRNMYESLTLMFPPLDGFALLATLFCAMFNDIVVVRGRFHRMRETWL